MVDKRHHLMHDRFKKQMARGARCDECAMHLEKQRGPVPGEVRPGTGVIVVGEAPGTVEVDEGQPFRGPSGEKLNQMLEAIGRPRDTMTVTNGAICQPPNEASAYLGKIKKMNAERKEQGLKPLLDPWTACAGRLSEEIKKTADPDGCTLIPLGGRAHESLARMYGFKVGSKKAEKTERTLSSISSQRGHPALLQESPRIVTVPTVHPAYAMRAAPSMLNVIADDLRMAFRVHRRGHRWKPPKSHVILYAEPLRGKAFAERAIKWCQTAKERGAPITCDIETDGIDKRKSKIRCIGLAYRWNNKRGVIVIPFRLISGRRVWSMKTERLLAGAIYDLFEANLVVGHNFYGFDVDFLERDGFYPVGKPFEDTMIMHHNTRENDLRHGIDFVSSRFCEIHLWKDDVNVKAQGAETEVAEVEDWAEYGS